MIETGQVFLERDRIKGVLGAGGAGTVYRAVDKNTKREVAIKVYSSDNGKLSKARIQREVEIISKLQHPNIIALFDVGVSNGNYLTILVNSDRRSCAIRPSIPEISGHRSWGIRPAFLSYPAKGRHLMHGV